jgi:two-component system, NtrC family, sensor kinase
MKPPPLPLPPGASSLGGGGGDVSFAEAASAEEADALRLERNGIFLVGAVLSVGLLAGSLLRHFSALELAVRILLTLLLLAAPWLARSVVASRRDAALGFILFLATVLICTVAALSGGIQGPEFSCLVAIPFLAGLILPHVRAVVWGLGLLVLVFGEAMLIASGSRFPVSLMWGALLLAGTTVAAMGARAYGRMFSSRVAAERARREASERLAESERRRVQSDRLALVGRLAGSVAHEISNPLTYLSTNLLLLEREADALQTVSKRDVQASVAESVRAVEHITEVLRDLRRFSRSEGLGEAAPMDVRPVVEEAVLLVTVRLRGIRLERSLAQNLPRVKARRRRVVQVLVNLLINAADAVGEPAAKERWIRVGAEQTEAGVTLVVEDSGPGLSPEARQHLFEPFFTTKAPGKGMGLGLALSREYVEIDGGTLTIEDTPGGGARVLVKLPVASLRPAEGG